MDFAPSDKVADLEKRLSEFVIERVRPAEPVYAEQVDAEGSIGAQPAMMEQLKSLALRFRPHETAAGPLTP
jgi:acyl-CoA dehydrogenase